MPQIQTCAANPNPRHPQAPMPSQGRRCCRTATQIQSSLCCEKPGCMPCVWRPSCLLRCWLVVIHSCWQGLQSIRLTMGQNRFVTQQRRLAMFSIRNRLKVIVWYCYVMKIHMWRSSYNWYGFPTTSWKIYHLPNDWGNATQHSPETRDAVRQLLAERPDCFELGKHRSHRQLGQSGSSVGFQQFLGLVSEKFDWRLLYLDGKAMHSG